VSRLAEPIPVVAEAAFPGRSQLLARFGEWLGSAGVKRGLLGPREAVRIWDRHLLNCAVLAELIPVDSQVVDLGSGAGLPGVALACVRPDLRVDLVEPLLRRTAFLTEVIADLDLGSRVRVYRGRAESPEIVASVGGGQLVTARALAPLDRLASWALPLLRQGGRLLAIKGSAAEQEVAEHAETLRRLGAGRVSVIQCGAAVVDPPSTVVIVERGIGDRKSGRTV
jgi:16S rRNA (guanine527-N7)-methyltransferase